ncbi:RnfABCDGE type electron transport complex subunit D [Litorimonas taeanensis]|uniref:RnfABCDGE type electron transport complex subunit D n=1 Tax=Litorimonas taeanensis TaxID=568099 RepID=UPI0014733200|nr:RnfABCDGE type electron transport complex subunit D [Litorimonas taeanensis]
MSKTQWIIVRDWLSTDPRHYQIAVLSTLILLGVFHFGFELPWWHVVGCVGSTLTTQALADKVLGRPFDLRSPLISALSLTILLRTGSVTLSIAAGVLAISSKYILRWNGKHIFNPANFGLVVLSTLFSAAWISPGQWGQAPFFALLLLSLGGVVTGKAKRWDVSLALLGSYAVLVFARALWLGDPMTIPVHQMQSGALLIFAFFMISDPKTTPDARGGRLIYAPIVAIIGFTIQFGFYNSAGIILGLILTAPFVPLIDRVFKNHQYVWPRHKSSETNPASNINKETNHASFIPAE